MFNWLQAKCSRMLGIDIGLRSIKMLELSRMRRQYFVESFAYVEFEPYSFEDITLTKIANYIHNLLDQNQFSSSVAAIAIPDSLINHKILQIKHYLSNNELEEFATIAANKSFASVSSAFDTSFAQQRMQDPTPTMELNIDFKRLNNGKKSANGYEILLVAAKAEHVQRRVEALSWAGLKVKMVDIESYAIGRSAYYILNHKIAGFDHNMRIAVLDIEVHQLRFIIVQQSQIQFVVEEALALSQFVESELLYIIKKTIRLFDTASIDSQINLILVSGAIMEFPQIAGLLQNEIGISTYVANPLQQMKFGNHLNPEILLNIGSRFMVACGLALRQFK